MSGNRLSIPPPVQCILGYNESKTFQNVDINALQMSAEINKLVSRVWVRIEYINDPKKPTAFLLGGIPVGENVIASVVDVASQPVQYLRRGQQYTLRLDANVQVDGPQDHHLFVGGVEQSSTLNFPTEVVFGVHATNTPLGINLLKLIVGGRLVGWLTVIVQPVTGFLPNN